MNKGIILLIVYFSISLLAFLTLLLERIRKDIKEQKTLIEFEEFKINE